MPKEKAGAGSDVVAKGDGKGKTKKPKEETPLERFKMDVAEELGLADKVQKLGWGGLTAAESGRVGGYMTKKLKAGLVPPGLVEQVENALQFKR